MRIIQGALRTSVSRSLRAGLEEDVRHLHHVQAGLEGQVDDEAQVCAEMIGSD